MEEGSQGCFHISLALATHSTSPKDFYIFVGTMPLSYPLARVSKSANIIVCQELVSPSLTPFHSPCFYTPLYI